MALKLYMHPLSPPSQSVQLLEADLGLKLEKIVIDIFTGEHLKPEYRKKNPQHTLPLLEDGDFLLWDSHAIMAYLVSQYGKNDALYPKDTKKRAKVDQRMHFNGSVLFPRFGKIIRAVVFRGATTIADDLREDLLEAYDFLEAFFQGHHWVAGDTKTIADYALLASISTANGMIPMPKDKYPKISAWFETCTKLPFYESACGNGSKALAELFKSKLQ